MLTDLFKPAWKSSSVEKRLKAIAAMDGANLEQQKILAQLASDDEDATICIAAIQKLRSAPALHEISLKHANDTVRTEASNRLNELMGESASLSPQQFDDILKLYPELKVRVAAHAELATVRNQAIQGMSAEQLLEVLSETTYTDSRQQIANMLLDVESLDSARKIMRGKDKNAERIVKTKLDEFRRQEREQAENLVTVNELIEEVEYLSSRDGLPEFMTRCLAHCSRWDSLDFEIESELKQRYKIARELLDTQYQERITVEQTQQSQQELVDELQSLLQKVAERDFKSSIDQFFETHEKHDQLISSWQSLALISAPDKALYDQYLKMITALNSAIQLIEQIAHLFPQENNFAQTASINNHLEGNDSEDLNSENKSSEDTSGSSASEHTDNKAKQQPDQPVKALSAALKKLNWPLGYGVLQIETELRNQLAAWQKAQQDAAEKHEQQLALAHKNISSIFHFSRIGNLARAKQMCVRVEKALDQFSGKDRAALEQRFEEARETLGDMGDWKNFATEPKYVELCEAMEQLVGSKQHPDKLSSSMKAIQQQWKALGNSDISDQYWPRFKEAADAVYQPCAVFFEERHKLRKANFAQRQQYVEQLRELLEQTDWDNNPDFKTVESTVRSISNHFYAIKEVERNPGQKQWEQFSKIKDAVLAKLDVAYDANIELKQQLIKQTEALAQAPANEENLTTLKTLQNRWKLIGITRRNQDQKAWTVFKKLGDQIYNKVQELRQEQRDKTDQQLNVYRDAIKEIQTLAKTATELSEADHKFSELQASYAELPDLTKLPQQLPEKLIEGIQRDYRNACAQFDECHTRIISSMRKQQLDALRRKAELCTQLEALGESPAQQQLEQIEQQWEAIELHDAELSRRIEARRESAQTVIDRTEITAKRRILCIQLEIAKDSETPSEDKSLRMQFQLEQMNKSGLGLQTLNIEEQLKNMELDWLCMPGAEPQQQAILDERFWRALDN
jgi:hypothetical protein